MKEGIKILLCIVAVVGIFTFGHWSGSLAERISVAPQRIETEKRIIELENELQVQNRAWYVVRKAGVVVNDAGIVSDGSPLAIAGVPVGSFVVTTDKVRIFAVYMYHSVEGTSFPVAEEYRWETDNSPRQFLKKLPQ